MANPIKILTPNYSGYDQIGQSWVPDSVQRLPLGTTLEIVDPYWGPQEVIYLKVDDIGTYPRVGSVKYIMDNWVATPVSASLIPAAGQPICVSMNKLTAAGVYSWFIIRGRFPVAAEFDVNVGTTPAVYLNCISNASAGSNIQGMVVNVRAAAAAGDGTFTGLSVNKGLKLMHFSGEQTAFDVGLFIGQKIGGTGLNSNTIVSTIDPDGTRIGVSAAPSASGAPTITKYLYNILDQKWWPVCTFFNPYAAGAV